MASRAPPRPACEANGVLFMFIPGSYKLENFSWLVVAMDETTGLFALEVLKWLAKIAEVMRTGQM